MCLPFLTCFWTSEAFDANQNSKMELFRYRWTWFWTIPCGLCWFSFQNSEAIPFLWNLCLHWELTLSNPCPHDIDTCYFGIVSTNGASFLSTIYSDKMIEPYRILQSDTIVHVCKECKDVTLCSNKSACFLMLSELLHDNLSKINSTARTSIKTRSVYYISTDYSYSLEIFSLVNLFIN